MVWYNKRISRFGCKYIWLISLADVKNILNFPDAFKDVKIIRLEQNYRSTDHILAAASKLIENNKDRLGKNLWTEALNGEKLKLYFFEDGKDEAKNVSFEIEKLKLKKTKLDEIAILVRASFQTRLFEDRLLKIGIPLFFLTLLVYYTLFLPIAELGEAMVYLTTAFLSGIALYFSTERPQPLVMTTIDHIFAFFYFVTGGSMILVIFAKFLPDIYNFLITPLRYLIPLSLIGFLVYLFRRLKAKKFKPNLLQS